MTSAVRAAGTVLMLVLVLAACGGDGEGDAAFVTYERAWPDGVTESTEIFDDGRVAMSHGDVLERFTISSGDVDTIKAALADGFEADADGASPVRMITLEDGTVIENPRSVPGSATDLLDRLMNSHDLEDPVVSEGHDAHRHPDDEPDD